MTEQPKRRPNRLTGYDYNTDGGYFITICTDEKRCILWDGNELSILGKAARSQLEFMENYYPAVTLDKYVIMPNHVHMILLLQGAEDHPGRPLVPRFISAFKNFTNKQTGRTLWQKSYHDHIIRNHEDYLRIWQYIDENPVKWFEDRYFYE